jgi:valacyclovir hydrolase
MAANAAERIRSLVVWGGNSYLSEEEITAFQGVRAISSWSQRDADAMRQVYGDSLDSLWESYVVGLEELYAAGGEIYRSQLKQVQCPTLVLHGEKDPLVPAFHPRIICEGIRGSLLHVFPEGKHKIHAKYAAEFNRITSGFIARQFGAESTSLL